MDHRVTFESQFNGMTQVDFTYDIYEDTRTQLIKNIREGISKEISEFLVTFSEGSPNWELFNFDGYPGIQWKLLNINKLKKENSSKFEFQIEELRKTLKL